MNSFVWLEEHTELAREAMKHSSWAVINPTDMLQAIKDVKVSGGIITKDHFLIFKKTYGNNIHDNFRDALKYLNLIEENNDGLYELTQKGWQIGYYSGVELAKVVNDLGISDPQALNILGHNFLLHARESLAFCCKLNPAGTPKSFLEQELVDHYIFNQKLNKFKFDNLIHILGYLGIIDKSNSGYFVKYSPPALTFFFMVHYYLFLASNKIGQEVDAKDLQREVDFMLPNRSEDYKILGLHYHPIEGWGKRMTWIKPESFTQLLKIGLIAPTSIARILNAIVRDRSNPSQEYAISVLKLLKDDILKSASNFKGEPVNFIEVIRDFETS